MIFPGLIDPHVHLRDLGSSEKEDFYTGTSAALAGGFTTLIDMPNNEIPITTLESLKEKINVATDKIVCDVGFNFGSLGDNTAEFEKVKDKVIGLKLFLNETTGNYLLNEDRLTKIFLTWPDDKIILFHAEEEKIDFVLNILRHVKRRIHICHVSSRLELERIRAAKEAGLPVTCGVTPHHLFLTDKDSNSLGGLGLMKPFLKSRQDVDFLWNNLRVIDCIESDHAPHTLKEKMSDDPPFGVPGLETTLPLLITAMHQKKISLDEILEKCHTNPAKIFNIPIDSNTLIDVDETQEYEIKNTNLFTKCKWTPFNGWKVKGKVRSVIIRGTKVFENDKVLVQPGFGKIVY